MKMNNISQLAGGAVYSKQQQQQTARKQEIRQMLSGRTEREKSIGHGIVQDSLNYGKTLSANRTKAKDTALELKKLKYSFKSLSTQILRSKTSTSARQAAGAARREIQRLKNQQKSGKYDDEEIQAAIAHAKAMERAAKKKAAHLLEEEMTKTTGGACQADVEEAREKNDSSEEEVLQEQLLESQSGDLVQQEFDEMMQENLDAVMEEYQEMMEEMMEQMTEEMLASLEETMSGSMDEMMAELSEAMKEMMEDTGLEELADSMMAVEREMDPTDLKMLKIKHRNEEMKAITKADTEYLKAMFDHYNKQMASKSMPGMSMGQSPSVAVQSSVPMVQPVAVPTDIQMPDLSSVIDVSL